MGYLQLRNGGAVVDGKMDTTEIIKCVHTCAMAGERGGEQPQHDEQMAPTPIFTTETETKSGRTT